MLNPSCQYQNQVFDEDGIEVYNEGHNLFDIAISVKEQLDADGRIESFITRDGREEPSTLEAEAARTNEIGCDCLVALHSDAAADGSPGGGTWTFYTGKTHFTSEELDNLPFKLSDSLRLAQIVQRRTLEGVRKLYDSHDRGVREHWNRLYMLHAPRCPSCLVEILFHSNPVERELLKRADFHAIVGQSIASAIIEYFQGGDL